MSNSKDSLKDISSLKAIKYNTKSIRINGLNYITSLHLINP